MKDKLMLYLFALGMLMVLLESIIIVVAIIIYINQ